MWTAEITEKFKGRGELAVSVNYTDGKDETSETYRTKSPDSSWPTRLIEARLDELNALDTLASSITLGPVVILKPVPLPPTPADVAQIALSAAIREYQAAELLFNAGGTVDLAAKKADVAAAQVALEAAKMAPVVKAVAV